MQRNRRIAVAVLALLGLAALTWVSRQELVVTCERRAGVHDCEVAETSWERTRRLVFPRGALRSASVELKERRDADRELTWTSHLVLVGHDGTTFRSADQPDAGRTAEAIRAFLSRTGDEPLRLSLSNLKPRLFVGSLVAVLVLHGIVGLPFRVTAALFAAVCGVALVVWWRG